MSSQGSISKLITGLKQGDRDAQERIFERYLKRLTALAHKNLQDKFRRVDDEEDAVQSAFATFYRRATRGDFPKLSDRDNVWSLLATITLRKVKRHVNREMAAKRGGGRVHGGSAFEPEYKPILAEAAEYIDDYRRLLNMLRTPTLRRVAEMTADGFSRQDIASELDLHVSTVDRYLAEIRKTWAKEHLR